MALSDRLPDPGFKRHFTGAATHNNNGDFGPGFKSVKLVSDQKVMMSRTNSQRILSKAVAGQKWNIEIGYNPMTQDEFRPIQAFLQMKQGALTPFFVALPQYNTPANADWVADLTNTESGVNGGNPYVFTQPSGTTSAAGSTSLTIYSANWANNHAQTPTNIPLPGEIFTIADAANTNHKKTYMITTVETPNVQQAGTVPANHIRLGISPPLAKEVGQNAVFTFINPLFKVIMPTAIRSYSLNTDNLYSFSLKLEEHL